MTATVSALKYKLNVDNLDHVAGKTLEMNEVGLCNLSMTRPLVFDPYGPTPRPAASFSSIVSPDATVAAGHDRVRPAPCDQCAMARALHRQGRAGRSQRSEALRVVVHRPVGLRQVHPSPTRWSGGSTPWGVIPICLTATMSVMASIRISALPMADRVEKHSPRGGSGQALRRCRAHCDGVVHLAVPLRAEHGARASGARAEFIEIYVDTPLEVCEERDPKGLYRKARAGTDPQLHGHRLKLRAARAAGTRSENQRGRRPRCWPSWCSPSSGAGRSSSDHLETAGRTRMAGLRGAHIPGSAPSPCRPRSSRSRPSPDTSTS